MSRLSKEDWKPLTIASLIALVISTLVAGGTFILPFQDTFAFYVVVIIATLLLLCYNFIGALDLEKNYEELLNKLTHPTLERLYRILILTMVQGLFAIVLTTAPPQDAGVTETASAVNLQPLPSDPDNAEDAGPSGTTGTAKPETFQFRGLAPGLYLMLIGILYVGWDFLVDSWGAPKTTFWRFFWSDLCTFLAGSVILVVVLIWSTSNINAVVFAAVAVFALIFGPIVFALARDQ